MSMMDDFLRDNHEAILAAVTARMHGDETLGRVAAQRALSRDVLAGQVLGFWLQGIRSDLTLGSTATMEQSLSWLVSLRAGHGLPFEDAMVRQVFDEISREIDGRLESPALRREYASYRARVDELIVAAFPG